MTSRQRSAVLDAVAARVPAARGGDCVRVAVDGVDGAGKTVFAEELADRLRRAGRTVVRASVDDFHRPRAVRYRRGRDSAEGFWLDSFDYAALRDRLLDPLGPGATRRYRPAAHDLASDQPVDPAPQVAPPGAVLVVDGLFLHRDELAGAWELSVFLDVPFAVSHPSRRRLSGSVARMAARDGTSPDPRHPGVARYVGGQRLYFAACAPWRRADVVVDNADLAAPVLRVNAGTPRIR